MAEQGEAEPGRRRLEDLKRRDSSELAKSLSATDVKEARLGYYSLLHELGAYVARTFDEDESETAIARAELLSRHMADLELGLFGRPDGIGVDPEAVAFMGFLAQVLKPR